MVSRRPSVTFRCRATKRTEGLDSVGNWTLSHGRPSGGAWCRARSTVLRGPGTCSPGMSEGASSTACEVPADLPPDATAITNPSFASTTGHPEDQGWSAVRALVVTSRAHHGPFAGVPKEPQGLRQDRLCRCVFGDFDVGDDGAEGNVLFFSFVTTQGPSARPETRSTFLGLQG